MSRPAASGITLLYDELIAKEYEKVLLQITTDGIGIVKVPWEYEINQEDGENSMMYFAAVTVFNEKTERAETVWGPEFVDLGNSLSLNDNMDALKRVTFLRAKLNEEQIKTARCLYVPFKMA